MKHKKGGMKLVVKIMAAAIVLIAVGKTTLTYALIDETNAVHIDASSIEDATLIIGTHLIYLGSMNDQIYEAAMKSAQEANQYNRYYKSEIAGGTWYEISEAGALADITTDGIVVEDKVIEALFMTHHTKSDGITYELKTGKTVSVFDINDPYDLSSMTELDPIKLQYDYLVQMEDPSDTIERDILYIKEIYKFDRKTDKTREIDAQMNALQAYYNILVRDGAEEAMSDMVMSVLDKLDAARRVEVLGPLNDYQLPKMSEVITREFTYLAGEITGTYTIAEYREEKAKEAAAEAKQKVYGDVNAAQSELNSLQNKIDKEATEAAEKAANDILKTLDVMTEEEKAANEDRIRAEADEAARNKVTEIREQYAEELEEKQNEVSDKKENADADADKAAQIASEEVMNADRDVIEGFVPNSELISAVSTAMSNVQESYNTYISNMLTEGTTVLSKAEYRFSKELISNAQGQNYAACDTSVMKLIYLDRINNGIIREEADERRFIALDLLGEAEKTYNSSLAAGVGDAYKTLSSMAAASTKANVLKTQLSETEITRNELQFILQAYIDRMTPEDATNEISKRIDDIESLRSGIKQDAYETYANTSVDSYLEWLTKALKNIQDFIGGSDLDNLNQQKDDLQSELMSALDHNRLDQAKKLEAQIEALDKQIKELEQYLNSVLNSEYSSESEKALAAAQLGDGSSLNAMLEMRDDALENIKNGNLDDVANALEGIGSLAGTQPQGAMGALEDIYEALSNQELMGNDSSMLDELLSQVEDLAANQIDGLTNDLSKDMLTDLMRMFINDYFGGLLEDGMTLEEMIRSLKDDQMAVILAGLSMYTEETNGKAAEELLKLCSKYAYNNGNRYVYEQMKNEIFEFVPTDKLAQVMGYRYIFNDSRKEVTLQRGSSYYQFEAFSNVAKKGSDIEEMSTAAGFQSVIYIPEDIAQEYFTITAEYLHKTLYGVMLTDNMNQLSVEYFDYLLEAGGEY